jgi:hypothetical protein
MSTRCKSYLGQLELAGCRAQSNKISPGILRDAWLDLEDISYHFVTRIGKQTIRRGHILYR